MHNLRQPPEMTEQPEEKLVVFPSDDIVLRCEATGTPPREFRVDDRTDAVEPRQEDRGVTVVRGLQGPCMVNNSNGGQTRASIGASSQQRPGHGHGPEIRVTREHPQWPKEKVSPLEGRRGSLSSCLQPPDSAVPPKATG
nr:neuronal-glial cell adhesion molecule-like [Chelonoidis abingdonii]